MAEEATDQSADANEVDSKLPFEQAYARLEDLVSEMERGDIPLEELLARFEEGVGLVRHCRAFLKQAQLRVEQYIEQQDGHWVLKELD
jgi:exodeoxyribonuclease VII small subunit